MADRRDVGGFTARLLSRRRWMITALLLLHALAAIAGLVVPRILGSLVDAASAGGTLAATLERAGAGGRWRRRDAGDA